MIIKFEHWEIPTLTLDYYEERFGTFQWTDKSRYAKEFGATTKEQAFAFELYRAMDAVDRGTEMLIWINKQVYGSYDKLLPLQQEFIKKAVLTQIRYGNKNFIEEVNSRVSANLDNGFTFNSEQSGWIDANDKLCKEAMFYIERAGIAKRIHNFCKVDDSYKNPEWIIALAKKLDKVQDKTLSGTTLQVDSNGNIVFNNVVVPELKYLGEFGGLSDWDNRPNKKDGQLGFIIGAGQNSNELVLDSTTGQHFFKDWTFLAGYVDNAINALQSQVSDNKTQIASNKTNIATNTAEIIKNKTEIANLEKKGIFRGTYATLADARAAISNPTRGDYTLIGTSDPYVEYIYDTDWEQAGTSSSVILPSNDQLFDKTGGTPFALTKQEAIDDHRRLSEITDNKLLDETSGSNKITKAEIITDHNALSLITDDRLFDDANQKNKMINLTNQSRRDITSSYKTRTWKDSDEGKKIWITGTTEGNNRTAIGFISKNYGYGAKLSFVYKDGSGWQSGTFLWFADGTDKYLSYAETFSATGDSPSLNRGNIRTIEKFEIWE